MGWVQGAQGVLPFLPSPAWCHLGFPQRGGVPEPRDGELEHPCVHQAQHLLLVSDCSLVPLHSACALPSRTKLLTLWALNLLALHMHSAEHDVSEQTNPSSAISPFGNSALAFLKASPAFGG